MNRSAGGPVVIAGSSGLVGRALVAELRRRGATVLRLVRRPAAADDEITWDPAAGSLDAAALEGAGAVVNLAGAGIGDRRWNADRKQLLRDSRTRSAALLAAVVSDLSRPPEAILSASAIGFYGQRGDSVVTESGGPGRGFLAELCQEWEAAAQPEAAVRTVLLRTGLVLSADGLFLRRQLPLFKLGLGGRLGPPDRWVSWISLTDTVAAVCHLLGSDASGPVNVTAPDPVTNADFTRALGRALRRPAVLAVPLLLPGLLLGSEAVAGLTQSARVVPEALLADGFEFEHPDVATALAAALGRPPAGTYHGRGASQRAMILPRVQVSKPNPPSR
ncbi:MAG: TIGR01777 family oxidoreductase [bacterium]|nr:TIGR01777 family oxidoreductase [bacterium]